MAGGLGFPAVCPSLLIVSFPPLPSPYCFLPSMLLPEPRLLCRPPAMPTLPQTTVKAKYDALKWRALVACAVSALRQRLCGANIRVVLVVFFYLF